MAPCFRCVLSEYAAASSYTSEMSPSDPHEFDLVLRSELTIEATPEAVWAGLEQPAAWKPSVASIEHVAGLPGAAGEDLRVGQRATDGIVYVRMRTLASDPPRWKVQALDTEDGVTTRGYVTYRLVARAGTTEVYAQLVGRAALSAGAVPAGRTVAELAAEITEATRLKLDADHARLKRLVEQAA